MARTSTSPDSPLDRQEETTQIAGAIDADIDEPSRKAGARAEKAPARGRSAPVTPTDDDLARVARLYYEDDLTQSEIGDLLGIPRIKVTRMLAEARRTGVVSFAIRGGRRPFAREEEALQQAFDLERCWVASSSQDEAKTLAAVGRAGSAALRELALSARTIAVSLSSAVVASVRALPAMDGPATGGPSCIPLGGSWGKALDGVAPHELATILAYKLHGRSLSFPAPVLAGSASAAQTFMQDRSVAAALDIVRHADAMVAGIGAVPWPGESLLSELVSEDDLREALTARAVGDISAHFFDGTGAFVRSGVEERIVGPSAEDLVRIPHRLGIAFGHDKATALRATLSGKILNNVVTDIDTARELLAAETS